MGKWLVIGSLCFGGCETPARQQMEARIYEDPVRGTVIRVYDVWSPAGVHCVVVTPGFSKTPACSFPDKKKAP